ncbi:hypothetical protein K461DRAFT_318528 [Myriangium duriaei CBS 260.36]|uniref:C2H2-type domain-containing protein n=1 Tax=Myriangium duriaei CBS 260.36 TaxID=1168546 RepID=A0A9P4MK33_9PEZI|nr:hypothetical protein K461DRAFT_318528 [Myriangium duriaei CBS 260.36]
MASDADYLLYSYPDQQYGTHYTTAAGYHGPYMTPSMHTPHSAHAPRTVNPSLNKTPARTQSPSYSPALSASQSFDVNPNFSSTSDSGASGPSTISSAMASPSLNGQNAAEWVPGQQGLGIGIVHHDGYHAEPHYETFSTENFVGAEKFSGCVGESADISSSHSASFQSSSQSMYIPHSSVAPVSPPIGLAESSYWGTLPRTEGHSQPVMSSAPTESHMAGSPEQSRLTGTQQPFRSPQTPASATRSNHALSPLLARVAGQRRPSIPPAHRQISGRLSSPLSQEQFMNPQEQEAVQYPFSQPSQSHFFLQSSGAYVAPLESSYPSLIEPYSTTGFPVTQFPMPQSPSQSYMHSTSPALSHSSMPSRVGGPGPYRTERTVTANWQPYSTQRGHSVISNQSHRSGHSVGSCGSDEKREICPVEGCKRPIRDLKAHMLTHQSERPEKCPIPSCPYHIKGFARKYDKNRHTLTHFKGTMVCDFCPGSGTPSEKSFNRTDVFKRHFQSVHNVEQTTNSSRKKKSGSSAKSSPGQETPGVCRTCGRTFANAQVFHDHIDECVLEKVQQADPTEALNQAHLTSVANDESVKESLAKHNLSPSLDGPTTFDEDMDADADEDIDDDLSADLQMDAEDKDSAQSGGDCTAVAVRKTKKSAKAKAGLTWSKGGVTLNAQEGKGRKRREYPMSWGARREKMNMKKRVLCVFDGPHRLLKDDMMLASENEVRIPLPQREGQGARWITDLDVLTIQRAEAFLNATEEERGPRLDPTGEPFGVDSLMAFPPSSVTV